MPGKITLTHDMLIERDGWAIGSARKVTFGPFFARLDDVEIGPARTKTELLQAVRAFLRGDPVAIPVDYYEES